MSTQHAHFTVPVRQHIDSQSADRSKSRHKHIAPALHEINGIHCAVDGVVATGTLPLSPVPRHDLALLRLLRLRADPHNARLFVHLHASRLMRR